MSKHLPYPGRYESFSSWDFRCKQWESSRRRNQSRGLSGRPYKRYVEKWPEGFECEINNKKALLFRRGFGRQNATRTRDFAKKNGLIFEMYNGNGRT